MSNLDADDRFYKLVSEWMIIRMGAEFQADTGCWWCSHFTLNYLELSYVRF